jgi:hypothetical protein
VGTQSLRQPSVARAETLMVSSRILLSRELRDPRQAIRELRSAVDDDRLSRDVAARAANLAEE